MYLVKFQYQKYYYYFYIHNLALNVDQPEYSTLNLFPTFIGSYFCQGRQQITLFIAIF